MFILIIIILAIIIGIVSLFKREKENKSKVANFNTQSKAYTVYHYSGLPVASNVELFMYDCADCILISNADHNFTIPKSKITGSDFTTAPGINILWLLTIHYTSDGIQKSVALKGPENIKEIKAILDRQYGHNNTVEL
ncbi:MAG: hypothetical protein J6X78_12365 [Treponema sp.]|nr:hypothetical protein [Treponema sp.]